MSVSTPFLSFHFFVPYFIWGEVHNFQIQDLASSLMSAFSWFFSMFLFSHCHSLVSGFSYANFNWAIFFHHLQAKISHIFLRSTNRLGDSVAYFLKVIFKNLLADWLWWRKLNHINHRLITHLLMLAIFYLLKPLPEHVSYNYLYIY